MFTQWLFVKMKLPNLLLEVKLHIYNDISQVFAVLAKVIKNVKLAMHV